uniref:Uncharacterized protein n=1 Tax=Solanum lycopersicum TaxID=4081 RepID=A0A3Q7H773_SOLLC
GLKKSSGGLSIFSQPGKNLGVKNPCELDADELEQAHIYISKNCDEVLPYLKLITFKMGLTIAQLHKQDDSQIMEDLLSLSRGSTKYSVSFNGYVVSEYRFKMKLLKIENEIGSNMKSTIRYTFVAPGAIGKG